MAEIKCPLNQCAQEPQEPAAPRAAEVPPCAHGHPLDTCYECAHGQPAPEQPCAYVSADGYACHAPRRCHDHRTHDYKRSA